MGLYLGNSGPLKVILGGLKYNMHAGEVIQPQDPEIPPETECEHTYNVVLGSETTTNVYICEYCGETLDESSPGTITKYMLKCSLCGAETWDFDYSSYEPPSTHACDSGSTEGGTGESECIHDMQGYSQDGQPVDCRDCGEQNACYITITVNKCSKCGFTESLQEYYTGTHTCKT